MDTSTNVTYITMVGHVELEKYRYLYFVIVLAVYLLIVFFNALVIFVIIMNKCLHEPMYIFIAALLCNALFGATTLYPKLLVDFVSESQVASFNACVIQSVLLNTYLASEFTLLTVMAYDRYISICKPLRYTTLIKMSSVKKLLFFCWFVPSCEMGIGMIFTYQMKLCSFKINTIYCISRAFFKLSCGDNTVKNIYGLFLSVSMIVPPVLFVFFSYSQILNVCLRNSKDFRKKALQTCFPHLFVFICFTATTCFEIINSRLDTYMPHIVAMILSVENILIAPLINPIIYGLKLREIKRLIWKRKTQAFSNNVKVKPSLILQL